MEGVHFMRGRQKQRRKTPQSCSRAESEINALLVTEEVVGLNEGAEQSEAGRDEEVLSLRL